MSKARLIYFGLFTLIVIGFISCKTYYIPVDSFKNQFNGIDSSKLRIVSTQGPMGDIADYPANPIDYIKCVDKDNNPFELKNSPSIEIRFTEKNNKIYETKSLIEYESIKLKENITWPNNGS